MDTENEDAGNEKEKASDADSNVQEIVYALSNFSALGVNQVRTWNYFHDWSWAIRFFVVTVPPSCEIISLFVDRAMKNWYSEAYETPQKKICAKNF